MNSNLKCQDPPKFSFSGGWGEALQTNSNSKCQDLLKFSFWGRGGVGTEILEWGHSRNFEHKFIPLELTTASQIVSYTLREWRLIIITVLRETKWH